jgi:DNA-binding PadR family transcriptional regulator
VRDREDVDLLILAVLGDGVANGREIVALVRDRSGGAVELTERHVYQELQRLRHNRLIADTGRGERARFVLTDSGQRILDARARRWQAYIRAMGRVLGGV